MNDIEVKRLAHALNELRPDWPISSLTTWIGRNLANRPYRDAAIALVFVALDAKPDGTYVSDRPARVLESGPWWVAASGTAAASGRPQPPKRETQCRRCGGMLPDCPCTREHLAATYDDEPAEQPTSTGPDGVRAALRAAEDARRAELERMRLAEQARESESESSEEVA